MPIIIKKLARKMTKKKNYPIKVDQTELQLMHNTFQNLRSKHFSSWFDEYTANEDKNSNSAQIHLELYLLYNSLAQKTEDQIKTIHDIKFEDFFSSEIFRC